MCALKLDKGSIRQGEQHVLGGGQAARICLIDLLSQNVQNLFGFGFWVIDCSSCLCRNIGQKKIHAVGGQGVVAPRRNKVFP